MRRCSRKLTAGEKPILVPPAFWVPALAFPLSPWEPGPSPEPGAGVPAGEREELLQTVAALPADVSILLIEHDMDLVFSFSKFMTVLVNGAVLTEGAPAQIAADSRVKAVYLGHGDEINDGIAAMESRQHG